MAMSCKRTWGRHLFDVRDASYSFTFSRAFTRAFSLRLVPHGSDVRVQQARIVSSAANVIVHRIRVRSHMGMVMVMVIPNRRRSAAIAGPNVRVGESSDDEDENRQFRQ